MAVDDRPVVHVEANPLGQRDPLAMAAEAHEVVGRVKMLHAVDFLFDDRARIEVGRDVVAGRTDQFHATLVCLFVGIRADECGQETVVNVDNASGKSAAEIVGQNLHEPRQYDQFDILLFDQLTDLCKSRLAVGTVHLNRMKRNARSLGDGAAVVPVADDRGDLDRQFVQLGPPQDLVQAVVGFGDEHGRFHAIRQAPEVPIGLQRAAQGAEAIDEILDIHIQIRRLDFQAGEKLPLQLVGKLGELDQVSTVARHVGRDFGNDTRLIAAAKFKNKSRT